MQKHGEQHQRRYWVNAQMGERTWTEPAGWHVVEEEEHGHVTLFSPSMARFIARYELACHAAAEYIEYEYIEYMHACGRQALHSCLVRFFPRVWPNVCKRPTSERAAIIFYQSCNLQLTSVQTQSAPRRKRNTVGASMQLDLSWTLLFVIV